jgi:hypothetical protein
MLAGWRVEAPLLRVVETIFFVSFVYVVSRLHHTQTTALLFVAPPTARATRNDAVRQAHGTSVACACVSVAHFRAITTSVPWCQRFVPRSRRQRGANASIHTHRTTTSPTHPLTHRPTTTIATPARPTEPDQGEPYHHNSHPPTDPPNHHYHHHHTRPTYRASFSTSSRRPHGCGRRGTARW